MMFVLFFIAPKIVSGPHQYDSSIGLSSGFLSQPLLLDENLSFLLHMLSSCIGMLS